MTLTQRVLSIPRTRGFVVVICFVFINGWGFSPSFWHDIWSHLKSLSSHLAPRALFVDTQYCLCDTLISPHTQTISQTSWDLLKSWEKTVAEKCYIVGVGHSLGFQKLLSSPLSFHALISLCGFYNFLSSQADLRKKRLKDLQAMEENFNLSPQKTLRFFWKRCGVAPHNAPLVNNFVTDFNKAHLQKDLQRLRHNLCPHNVHQIFMHTHFFNIEGQKDIIVSQNISKDNFKHMPHQTRLVCPEMPHAPRALDAPFLAQKMLDYVQETSSTPPSTSI